MENEKINEERNKMEQEKEHKPPHDYKIDSFMQNTSKKTLIKWIKQHQQTEFKIKTECNNIYHINTDLNMKLTQEKDKNKMLEKEINEYDKTMGMIEQEPIKTTENIEETSILPPIDKLSDYQIWKNEQDKVVYRKKVFKKIKNKGVKNNVEFDECCICYEENNSFKVKTNCKHDICMSCILKINKKECPMCREPFPEGITNLLNKDPEYAKVYSSSPQGIDNWFSWGGTPQSTGFFIHL